MSTTSSFSQKELKTAENVLIILAQISADFWQEAILSNDFVLNGRILDYERGYKDRVQKILSTVETRPVSFDEAIAFKKAYLVLAKEEIEKILNNPDAVAALLGKYYASNCYINFGGWDNDPTGTVAKAMKIAGIKGYMHYGSSYRKTKITLFFENGIIRKGFHKWDEEIYTVR